MSRPLVMDKLLRDILKTRDISELPPSKLAEMVHYLIKHEISPGGPYEVSGKVDAAAANKHIQRVFIASNKPLIKTSLPNSISWQHLAASVASLYRQAENESLPGLTESEKDLAKSMLDTIKLSDVHGEICQLSQLFYASLSPKNVALARCTEKSLRQLSIANIFTWGTYSFVDRILDKNNSNNLMQFLPIILKFQRTSITQYLAADAQPDQAFELFNSVDQANSLELDLRKSISIDKKRDKITIYSLPSLSTLRDLMPRKSIAHVLGPLTIIQHSSTVSILDTTAAMYAYCAARQYQDDLHDWIDDLLNGELTYSIGLLFAAAKIKPGVHSLSTLKSQLQQAYWNDVLEASCKEIEQLIDTSITSLERSVLTEKSKFVIKIIKPIAFAARQARKRHLYEKSFLSAFMKNQVAVSTN